MRTADFDYDLPPERIAQQPVEPRDASRLLLLARRGDAAPRHLIFRALEDLLSPGDLLVLNDTRVIPARLFGERAATGGRVEVLLVRDLERGGAWEALLRAGGRPRAGERLLLAGGALAATLLDKDAEGTWTLRLEPAANDVDAPGEPGGAGGRGEANEASGASAASGAGSANGANGANGASGAAPASSGSPAGPPRSPASPASPDAARALLDVHGIPPLPPYIRRDAATGAEHARDRERYQTVFARVPGAVAAPTAGLHFTPALLDRLAARGVERAFVTLHVGPGTFRPVTVEDPREHPMHAERYAMPAATRAAIERTRARGGRVVACGTTAVRTIETVAAGGALEGETRLFIHPPYEPRWVDGLITNFHLPRSTLLLLVSAFVGRERLLAAYAEAVREGYRFFSYGDAMAVL